MQRQSPITTCKRKLSHFPPVLGTSVEKKSLGEKNFSTQKRCCMPGERGRGRGRDPRENALSVSRNERERRSFLPPTSSVVVVQREGGGARRALLLSYPPLFPVSPFPFFCAWVEGGGEGLHAPKVQAPPGFTALQYTDGGGDGRKTEWRVF